MSDTEESVESTPLTDILSGDAGNLDESPTDVKTEESASSPSEEKTEDTDESTKVEEPEAKEEDSKESESEEKPEVPRDDEGKDTSIADEVKGLRAALKETRATLRKLKEEPVEEPEIDFDADPETATDLKISKVQQEAENRFFLMAEKWAKDRHEDYTEVVNELMADAEEDPSLAAQVFPQLRNQPDPAEFLYTFANNRRELKKAGGDLTAYKESIEAPLNTRITELEKELKQTKEQLDALGKVRPSLNDESSSTSVQNDADNEPTPMTEILKRKKRA